MVIVLPIGRGSIAVPLCVGLWDCPQDTHLCSSRLQGELKSKFSAPKGMQRPLILYLNLTLNLKTKRREPVNTVSIQTLLSHSAFGVLPVTIIEHSSVSGCSESARIRCEGWHSS